MLQLVPPPQAVPKAEAAVVCANPGLTADNCIVLSDSDGDSDAILELYAKSKCGGEAQGNTNPS